MHALDHAGWGWANPRFSFIVGGDQVSPKYRSMYEVQVIVRCMMSTDIPMVMFPKYYRNAPTEFHKEVYEVARKLDPKLADEMQVCIVK